MTAPETSMPALELLPSRASYGLADPVRIEVRGLDGPAELTVWRLGEEMARMPVPDSSTVDLGALPAGGYGVEVDAGGCCARTAVEVTADPRARLRYGFVVDYSPGRDVTGVSETVRRLHLNGIQFYDWAYRHAELLGGGDEYDDALGQPVSLDTVRALVTTVQEAGARAIGYAAVYAAGPHEWPRWEHRALLTGSGAPYGLGDFLFLLDPAAEDWLGHLTAELARATAELGFDGFHLDQYGYPKRAMRADGTVIDLAESFLRVIERVRETVPRSTVVFNNVNDFPTWRTAHAPQDAVYIEVWPPHVTVGSLAGVVARARANAEGKPIVIAAYQHVYDSASAQAADLATRFTMATLYSHGATQLLAGEADRILVDPYYVRNHVAEASTAHMLRRWYDFLVEHDELLLDTAATDVTGCLVGEYNDDCDIRFDGTDVTGVAQAGSVWRRIVETNGRLVMHLINLVGQEDTEWDAARRPLGDPGASRLRVRRVAGRIPRVRVADPDRMPRLVDVPVTVDGDFAFAELPAPGVWQLVVIDVAHGTSA